jgi:hypothetical protein
MSNKELVYIVYSNTDYLEVLEIQTDYATTKQKNCILFINHNDLGLEVLYSNYQRVVFYNDQDSYATRLRTCIEQLEDAYFLFTHDIDILLNVELDTINNLYEAMVIEGMDRIDLKHTDNLSSSRLYDISSFTKPGTLLVKQDDIHSYIYNVNPSIWKRSSFLELLNAFPQKGYRNIEDLDVQTFCTRFDVYKIHTSDKVECGYFNCVDFYTYLHISHSGRLLPLNETFTTPYNQSYRAVKDEYIKIVNSYNLKNSKKWIN